MLLPTMELNDFLTESGIQFEKNIPLSKKTWIKTGGVCDYWILPDTISKLEKLSRYLYEKEFQFEVVGQTSNIFFHSSYNPQIIVSTVGVKGYEIKEDILTCACGCNVTKLARECMSLGYAGFSGLTSLPGTVASAAINNASCFDCSISSMLISADVLMPDGSIRVITNNEFKYEKRSSAFKKGELEGVLLSLKLQLMKAQNIEDEIKKSDAAKEYRKRKQEGPNRNLGSVFAKLKRKNNIKNKIAFLITKIAALLYIGESQRLKKKLLLWIYGYVDLDRYISDKQINTFIWRDADAEAKFVRYKEFMNRVYDNLVQEIEERK